jgi:pimeloyl-ACP methyl ester carboxylesterase
MYSLAQVINDYAGVTVPDLPGFGGMDSFYKIGEKPDLDTMADYLATIIKLRYRGRRLTLAAISYGFIVATRMLQRYPDLAKKVDLLISVVGFAHYQDFTFSKTRFFFYKNGARFFSYKIPAFLFRNIALNPWVLKNFYSKTHNAKHKFADLSPESAATLADFEVHLWRTNDLRTHMATSVSFLSVDNCRVSVDLAVHHIGVKMDNYFDNNVVEQHMRVIFTDFIYIAAPVSKHMPNVIAGKQEAAKIIPTKLRRLLAKQPT